MVLAWTINTVGRTDWQGQSQPVADRARVRGFQVDPNGEQEWEPSNITQSPWKPLAKPWMRKGLSTWSTWFATEIRRIIGAYQNFRPARGGKPICSAMRRPSTRSLGAKTMASSGWALCVEC